ncbi:MAG TPA: hypothetical protein VMM77_11625 [Gemmatimonadaceae bacterium]|nr:hypothetical protein [Gemmatimonadaceae bacterium]
MRALIEKVVRAVAVTQIVEAPRVTVRDAGPDGVLIDEHLNRPQVALKVLRVGVRARQFDGRQACIMLRRLRRRMAEPRLQFKQRERLLRIEKLRRNR